MIDINFIQKIVIIGTGKLAWHLGSALKSAGFEIVQVVGRTAEKSGKLAQELGAQFVVSIDSVNLYADLYVLCVSDDIIHEVIKTMPVVNGICVHVSGSKGIDVFGEKYKNFGIFYPLQTFSEGRKLNFIDIPILIEANSEVNNKKLIMFAENVSNNVFEVNSEERIKLHLAAVFVSNFVNALLSVGNELISETNLPFRILYSLVLETVNKAFDSNPDHSQTGPALRGDHGTMDAHLQMLQNKPELAALYSLFSNYITQKFSQ